MGSRRDGFRGEVELWIQRGDGLGAGNDGEAAEVTVPMELDAERVTGPGASGVTDVARAVGSVVRVQVVAPHASKRAWPSLRRG